MINALKMQSRREKQKISFLMKLLLVTLLVLAMMLTNIVCKPAYASRSSTTDSLVNGITRIRDEKEKLEEQLANVEAAQLSAQEELNLLTTQRLLLDQEYAYQSELVDLYQLEVAAAQAELIGVQEEEIRQYKELKTILRAMEESPKTSFWGVVFESTSLKDVLSYISMMSEVVLYSQRRLDELAVLREEIADIRFKYQSLQVKYMESLRDLEAQEIEMEEQNIYLEARIAELAQQQADIAAQLEHIQPEVTLSASQKELTQPLPNGTIETLLTMAANEMMETDMSDEGIKLRLKMLGEGLKLVGNVPYFWGGRSYSPGWNDKWNTLQPIQHAGCEGYQPLGEYFPYGLDCSGFVFWSALTLYGKNSWLSPVEWMSGRGATGIYTASEKVEWDVKMPGDMVVNTPITHIGFYLCTNEDGEPLYLHCCGNFGVIVSTSDFCDFDRAATIF